MITLVFVFFNGTSASGVHQKVLLISSLSDTQPHTETSQPFWGCPSFPCILSRHHPTKGFRGWAETFRDMGQKRIGGPTPTLNLRLLSPVTIYDSPPSSPSLSITSLFLVTFCNYISADCFTHHGGHSMREGGHLLFLLTTYFPEPGAVSGT